MATSTTLLAVAKTASPSASAGRPGAAASATSAVGKAAKAARRVARLPSRAVTAAPGGRPAIAPASRPAMATASSPGDRPSRTWMAGIRAAHVADTAPVMANTANVAARAEGIAWGMPGSIRTIHADWAANPYAFVMLDPVKLATLRAVIAEGSFSAAAGRLGLTQPAVSRHVALLERMLGTQLVRRTKRGATPTEAGRLLAEHAEAVLSRLALAEAQVSELAGLRRGTVRLGSFFTALAYVSAEAAVILEARHPALFAGGQQVIVDELVDRGAAMAGLRAGELDVAVVFEHGFERTVPPDDF